MIDIKEYLKQTKTVLITQNEYNELKRRAFAQLEPITVNNDHELAQEEYEKLRKDMANAPIVLLPSVQPEIIRCKDCEHYYKGNRCEMHEYLHFNEYDFCSYAERKEE